VVDPVLAWIGEREQLSKPVKRIRGSLWPACAQRGRCAVLGGDDSMSCSIVASSSSSADDESEEEEEDQEDGQTDPAGALRGVRGGLLRSAEENPRARMACLAAHVAEEHRAAAAAAAAAPPGAARAAALAAVAPTLIVTHIKTLGAWKAQLARVMPRVPLLLYHGPRRPKGRGATAFEGYGVVLTTFSTLKAREARLGPLEWWGSCDSLAAEEAAAAAAGGGQGGIGGGGHGGGDGSKLTRRGFGRVACKRLDSEERVGSALHKQRWQRVVVDDMSQLGKSPTTLLVGAASAVRARARWVLTDDDDETELKRGVLHFLRAPVAVPPSAAERALARHCGNFGSGESGESCSSGEDD